MFSYIEKLRNEPLEKRKKTTVRITVGIVSVIVVIWIGYLFIIHTFFNEQEQNTDKPSEVGGIVAPY